MNMWIHICLKFPKSRRKAVWLKQTAWSKIRKENGLLRNEFLLVGDGRMVNTLTNALVSVAGNAGGGHVDYLLDTDLTNAAAINTSAVGANLIMNTLVSVKDVYHTYAAHQSAGFVIRSSNPGLLDVKALNGF